MAQRFARQILTEILKLYFAFVQTFFSLHISTYLFIVVYASKNVLSERRALQADVAPSTYRGRDQVMTVPRDSDKDCIRRD